MAAITRFELPNSGTSGVGFKWAIRHLQAFVIGVSKRLHHAFNRGLN